MIVPNYTFKAKIINVVDGDTVDAHIDVGFKVEMTHRLRLNRVQAAEMTSKDPIERAKALTAKVFVIDNVLNKDVVITTSKADAFGRYLAEVYYMKLNEQVCLNDEMLNNQLAQPYVK